MKFLITGANGMLGSELVRVLASTDHTCVATSQAELDIANPAQVNKEIGQYAPDVVVNCAAYTDVDGAEKNKQQATSINTTSVQHLAEACNLVGARLVQISTDYVFDGSKESYLESDPRNPVNYYGQTKADAEVHIEEQARSYQIVRTSWLFGPNGKNFVDTIAAKSKELKKLSVVTDQVGSPTYTYDLAAHIIELQNQADGVYHVTNEGVCSWFDFATEIVAITESDCIVQPTLTVPGDRAAKRPQFSVLTNSTSPKLRHWKEALLDYLDS